MVRLWKLFAASSMLLVACSGGDDGNRKVGSKKANESVQDAEKLVVRDGSGDLRFEGVKSLSLNVEATVTSTESSESKDNSALAEVVIEPEAAPDSVVLDFRWELPKGYGTSVVIEASKELTLEINDKSGDIYVSDWEGKVIIKDTSGDVVLENVEDYKIESKSSGKLVVDGEEEIFE